MQDFNAMTIPQLRQHAADNGIAVDGLTRKQDIIDAILAATAPDPAPEAEGAPQATETATGDTPDAGDDPETERPPESVTETITPPPEDPPHKPPEGDKAFVIARALSATKPLLRGDDVGAVHAALIEKGLHVGKDSTEGIYGAATAYAVRLFQSQNRLIVSGRVDKFTARALGFEWEDPPAGK